MKTIFITCFFGIISRDILGTGVLRRLKEREGLRIVILAPRSRQAGLSAELAAPNIEVVGVELASPGRIETMLRELFLDLLNTRTRRIQRLVKLKRGEMSRLGWMLSGIAAFLGRFRLARSFARFLDCRLSGKTGYEIFFERYRPSLLFATDIMTPHDVAFMRTAGRFGVATIGMVRSWDNLTMYGICRILPPRIIVQNEQAKKDLVSRHDAEAERIAAVGIPHYDEYLREERSPREEFLRSFGLDPQKKTIFATLQNSKHLIDQETNRIMIDRLAALGANVLVRSPIIGEARLGNQPLPPNVAVDRPGGSNDVADVDLTRAADRHLADSIASSDVVVTGPSTIAIDGVVLGKPVVLLAYEYAKLPYWQRMERLYDYDHIRAIASTGGVRVARSEEEFVAAVQSYLADPGIDRVGRERLLREKRQFFDGKSAERMAREIIEALP